MEESSSSVSMPSQPPDPVTPERAVGMQILFEETPTAVAGGDPGLQNVPKRELGDKETRVAKRARVQKVMDPAKVAEKEVAKAKRAEDRAAAKLEAKTKRVEEKAAAKQAAQAAKEADKAARDVRKMIGDTLKGKLKGKKKRVNGRRVYSVPGSTVIFQHMPPSEFDHLFSAYGVTVKRNGSKCVALKAGQMQEIFGKTKCQGGSMYATFEISTANIVYERSQFSNDMDLKITYKTACTRESFW